MAAVRAEQLRVADVPERDIELAITALKKGAPLLKYGRRGKPKFCPFRLSNDESVLIWISGKEEKYLKLNQVSRIIPGQRTPIFQRYPRPEKEYQSFSLIYHDRSLDLICKDKDEAEVWFTGLKALISRGHNRKGRPESRSDGISSEATSPKEHTRRSSPLSSPFGSGGSSQKDGMDSLRLHTPHDSPPRTGLEKALSDVILYSVPPKALYPSESACGSIHSLSSAGSDGTAGYMKGLNGDAYRVSLSSAVSSSSQGSGHYDGDALGDVFIWGEGTGDGVLGGGIHRIGNCSDLKIDSLLPKALESAVLLDVQNIACGGQHAALVTKQGEVFSWGVETGGRLGHGVDSNVSHPKLIDSLKNINVELVACGEYYSCAVTLSGELYTWGGSSGNFGLLGHGSETSQWVPKKLNGPLEGIHVSSVSCGPWHTAVVTSAGQLFTFGDGTFGVLGHGDRKSISVPREVESLKGLRTVRAACGVWHTAAVVEVMVGSPRTSNCSSGKLFTWGDGDKGRLGHGDKEARLVPTCVAALPCLWAIGNPQADGKLPIRVEGKLTKSFVEEIACGAYHGANGRLGHGDTDDRSSPFLVEALKDKQVKSVVCGTSFTAAICLHKSVSSVDQSKCSGCRLCLISKENAITVIIVGLYSAMHVAVRSLLRLPWHQILTNLIGTSNHYALSRIGSMNQGSNDSVEEVEKLDSRNHAQLSRNASIETSKGLDSGSSRNKRLDFNSTRVSPFPNGASQCAPQNNPKTSNGLFGSSKKFFSASLPTSRIVSRATSPTSRRSSPHRATTPTPTLSGVSSKKVVDDAKRTNEGLSEEVVKLRSQVEELTRKAQLQEVELENTTKQLKEAIAVATEETAKCKAAKEVIKSLTAQAS
ncbi:hypothetical protein GQ457_09G025770 [Hibiscus cannabinus]